MQRGEACAYTPTPREATADVRFAAIHRKFDIMEARFDHIDALLHKILQDEISKGTSRGDSTSYEQRCRCTDQKVVRFRDPLLFNNRVAHMKAHTVGGQENSSISVSSIFLSILSPQDISMLSKKLGDPLLSKHLETTSHNVWQEMQKKFVQIFGTITDFAPDLNLLEATIGIFSRLQNAITCSLLPVKEIGTSLMPTVPDPIKKGQLAAIVFIGCVDMRLRNNFGDFSSQVVQAHERAAVCQAIKTLSFMRFSQPAFLHVRLSTLLLFFLMHFTAVPSLSSFIDPIIGMSKAIGLYDSDKNLLCTAQEAEWRESVKLLVCQITYDFRIMLSQKPPKIRDVLLFCKEDIFKKSEVVHFSRSQLLNRMYDRSYRFTFTPRNLHIPSREICENIKQLDSELEKWWETFSDKEWASGFDPNRGAQGALEHILLSQNMLKYHYIMIVVHSIPAYCPDALPEHVTGSLEKVAAAARALYSSGRHLQEAKQQCTMISSAAITTAICTLLYKQLCYPSHPSNHRDLSLLQSGAPSADSNIPYAAIWRALIDIMNRHYEFCNLDTNSTLSLNDREVLVQEFFEDDECVII